VGGPAGGTRRTVEHLNGACPVRSGPEVRQLLLPMHSSTEKTMHGTNRDDAQPGQVDVDQEQELEHWANKLDATPQQVKDAVKAVGSRPEDVEMHLKGVRSTTNSDRMADQKKPN